MDTLDEHILNGGTTPISGDGKCDDFGCVISMAADDPPNRVLTGVPAGRFTPIGGEAALCAAALEMEAATGLCERVSTVRVGGVPGEVLPGW